VLRELISQSEATSKAVLTYLPLSAELAESSGYPRFLRLPEVRQRVPYSRPTIYRLVKSGDFPKPYNLGARAVAWLESDITAWIEARVHGKGTGL
jgi:prophage regulatory protein